MSKESIGQLKATRGQLDIEWCIPDFLSLSAVDFCNSPTYFLADSSWSIRVYPNKQGFVSVYVKRGDSGPPVTVIYGLFLKKKSGGKEVLTERKYTFKRRGVGHGTPRGLRRSELIEQESEFLSSGTLTVVCNLKLDGERKVKVDMLRGVLIDSIESKETESDFESKRLAVAVQGMKVLRDYENLLQSEENFDMTLQVRGQTFKVHRAILGARCPVFASMLSHDMKERNTGLIDVKDCNPENFSDFLRFLYSGDVEIITSQNVCSLYRTSDKYDVQDLKSECLTYMKDHVTVDNFCDIITLALQHNETDLVRRTTDFFVNNMLDIVVTAKWQMFLHENTTEGNELIIRAANKMSNP